MAMKSKFLLFVLILASTLAYFLLREVCTPIDDVSTFYPLPIEQRHDSIWWVKTFQKKEDKWYLCKPNLWRLGHF
jgi:hypothetical protein